MGDPVGLGSRRPDPTPRYRIVVRGEFGNILNAAFSDVWVSTGDGNSVLVATFRDHQELYGLLDRLRDHGVAIEEVRAVPSGVPSGQRSRSGS